jgi:hypothetical protein
VTDDKRREKQVQKYRDDEARWLQKVLFDLGKAREARANLAEANGEDLNPLITLEDGTSVPVDIIEEVITKRIEFLMEALGRGTYGLRR